MNSTEDDAGRGVQRPVWDVPAPSGGWAEPWPQCFEIARSLGPEKWTLVGGLMVQVHMARARRQLHRSTTDVDMVVHLETRAVTLPQIHAELVKLGYELRESLDPEAPAHRYVRAADRVDVMVADHLAPRLAPRLGGRRPVKIPGGTQALRRTVNCRFEPAHDPGVTISVPDELGALVLKRAAFITDSRDRQRHLQDALMLASIMRQPDAFLPRLAGSDRSRIGKLHAAVVEDPSQASRILGGRDLTYAIDTLRILSMNHNFPQRQRRTSPRLGNPDVERGNQQDS